ncbi:hypothetical protein PSTT_01381 [Puccinia striiformis]|uniref:Uncharacterized protein n=1 Tax=Puccinia striiformis TaxID=27350 RepID=A0A2S4W3E9_9BASI|nr:hypothetical protein PSTT_01381 [Puccinia striiformis]
MKLNIIRDDLKMHINSMTGIINYYPPNYFKLTDDSNYELISTMSSRELDVIVRIIAYFCRSDIGVLVNALCGDFDGDDQEIGSDVRATQKSLARILNLSFAYLQVIFVPLMSSNLHFPSPKIYYHPSFCHWNFAHQSGTRNLTKDLGFISI